MMLWFEHNMEETPEEMVKIAISYPMPVSLSLVCRDIVVLARSVISITTSTGSSVCRIEAYLDELFAG